MTTSIRTAPNHPGRTAEVRGESRRLPVSVAPGGTVRLDVDAGGRVREVRTELTLRSEVGSPQWIGRRVLSWIPAADRRRVLPRVRGLAPGDDPIEVTVHVRGAGPHPVPVDCRIRREVDGGLRVTARFRERRRADEEALRRQERDELALRTARELHDGILQTMTALGLRVAVARQLLREDPDRADAILNDIAQNLASEQQELRLYVDELRGRSSTWSDGRRTLDERLRLLLNRISRIWGIGTSVRAEEVVDVPGETARQAIRIVQEAAVNAARHGGAGRVSVAVQVTDRLLCLVIHDDGHGFSFRGEFDHAELVRNRLGPVSLKHRVEEAGGRVHIRSEPSGATVTVRLPLPA